MKTTFAAVGILVFLSFGCGHHSQPEPQPSLAGPVVTQPMSVRELGTRLDLAVVQSSPQMAELQGDGIRVRVFPEPASFVYIGDRPVVKTSGIVARGNEIYVPAEVETKLREKLPAPAAAAPGGGSGGSGRTANSPWTGQLPRIGQVRGILGRRVVIDAGHGGKDPGTHAKNGMREKDLTLAMASAVGNRLSQRGVKVLMTRRNDVFVELDERARLSNSFRTDLFVSIHADWNPAAWKEGHSIILPQSGDGRANLAARCISQAMVSAGSHSHIVRMDNRGLVVLKKTAGPSILIELGFLSNTTDAGQLGNAAFRQRLADAIALGIEDYLRR